MKDEFFKDYDLDDDYIDELYDFDLTTLWFNIILIYNIIL